LIEFLKKVYNFIILFKVPKKIKENFSDLSEEYKGLIESELRQNYFINNNGICNNDMNDHISGRTTVSRSKIIPWLCKEVGLTNKKLLEIGSGTGSSSITFAEQGANVVGIDVDDSSLEVARIRASLLNLDIKYLKLSGTDISTLQEKFDIVIYYASLEHMTIEERIASLRQAWNLLSSKGYLIIVEAPNRLWIEDTHTSELPFFQWLPDNLAYLYSSNSNKESFSSKYLDSNYSQMQEFLRRGRGVSFHEFELALKDLNKLNVVSSLSRLVYSGGIINTFIYKKLYKSYLRKQIKIHPAFFEEYLDIIIKKI
jgi:2-polyprenyl-3-methyl-5-hydroxy-6-metoxy-1,4-benzoquinol methylase